MNAYVQAFALGNAAILGNVCMLPLYPGLIALLANASPGHRRWLGRLLGVVVLSGVITSMVVIGALLHAVGQSVADVLPVLLPALYAVVIALGLALIAGANPFARLSTGGVPVVGGAGRTAFAYGLLLGPLTLPCTGPLIVSAFVIGSVGGSGALADGLAYFVAFGLGFGWPLAVLPLLASPFQARITRALARRHRPIAIASGALLVAVAAFGLWADVRPNVGWL